MNSTNKKKPGERGMPQPANRHAGPVVQSKLVGAQSKTAVSTQGVVRLIGPPVYKPQPRQTGIQAKMSEAVKKTAVTTQSANRPVAPQVYRPQAAPKVLQTKKTVSSQARQGVVQLWHRVAGQDGEFEGDPAHHHLHRVGGGAHYKYATEQGTRINYMSRRGVVNYGNVERAIAACGAHQDATGQAACLAELRQVLAGRPAPAVAVVAPVAAVAAAAAPAPVAPAEHKEAKPVSKKKAYLNDLGDKLAAKKDPWEF